MAQKNRWHHNAALDLAGILISLRKLDVVLNDGVVYDDATSVTFTDPITFSSNVTIGGTLSVSAAATLKGALSVAGAATLGSTLTVSAGATLLGALSVSGATTLLGAATLGSTLTVSAAATLLGTLSVGGATVLSSNLTVGGTLSVSAAATLKSTLSVGSTVVVGTDPGGTEPLRVGGTFNFQEAATSFIRFPTAANDVTQNVFSLHAGADVTLGAILAQFELRPSATGANRYLRILAGDTAAYRPIRLGNDWLEVTSTSVNPLAAGGLTLGTATLPWGDMHGGGNLTLSANATIGGTLTVSAAAVLTGAVTLGSTLTVSAATTLLGTLSVAGAAVLSSNLTIGGALSVSAGATLLGTLSVAGATMLSSNVTVGGLLLTDAPTGPSGAKLRLPHGTTPTTPVDGDLWTTTAGLFVRINGTTVGPLT